MSLIQTLTKYAVEADTSFTRPGFKVYAQFGTPGGGTPFPVAAGFEHYRNLGIGMIRSVYDISSGAFNQANAEGGVTFACTHVWPDGAVLKDHMDAWYLDIEDGYYTWDVAGASTCIADVTSVIGWIKAKFASYGVADAKIGAYSGNAAGLSTSLSYLYWNHAPSSINTVQANNDACGYYVSRLWDFAVPEMYSRDTDAAAAMVQWTAYEKTRMGSPIKLLPLMWPIVGGFDGTSLSYADTTDFLEYCIRIPECDGVALWAVSNMSATAPDYLDAQPYVAATLDFITKYGLTKGTPF